MLKGFVESPTRVHQLKQLDTSAKRRCLKTKLEPQQHGVGSYRIVGAVNRRWGKGLYADLDKDRLVMECC